jgi:hypothetical protein
LYSQPRVLSGQRENRQGEYVTTWHDTISDAVTNAHPTDLSSITVWQGTYVENIDFGDKELHVTNTSPTDHEVRENTQIIAADQTIPVVRIAGDQMETILEGFQITCDGTGVYCEEVTPVIRNNNIFYENSCAVELKRSNATLYNNNLISDKITVYMTDSEPEIHDNTIEGTDRAIEVVNSTPTVYDNVFLTLNKPGNGVYVDINSNVKNEEENLWQVFNVPYVKQADVENYTDGATSNTFTSNAVVASVRNVNPVEGQYIKFERVATHTKDGTFTLSPATAASNDGEDITIIATYTLAESFSNGTVTYVLDPAIDMDEVYITINGNRRAVTDEEKVLSGQNSQVRMQELNKINIKDICAEANEKIVLEIIQSSYLFEQEIFSGSERNGYLPNQNGMFVQVDRDGLGSLYTASDPEVGSVDIENNLEYIGSEATAYGITDNGETFYSYTVKVFKDKMPEKLRTIPEWEIEIRGTSEGTYYFRANQFNENVLQCDEIPNNTGITEEDIKEARFEPKQETPE